MYDMGYNDAKAFRTYSKKRSECRPSTTATSTIAWPLLNLPGFFHIGCSDWGAPKTQYCIVLFESILSHVPLVKLRLFVFETYFPSLNKRMGYDARAHIKNISLADNNVGIFADFQ